jgi:hypothetical protein
LRVRWVFWVVAVARFLVPLTIPRFPLPGIIASLVLDAVDQTIFQQFPGLELEGYQGYDKALDIYYFPNTFEYFFIFYEAYRLRWDPKRMPKKLLIGAAAFIWIVIKLPQEYWIHIEQIDTTDWIKTGLFKVPADTAWGEIFRAWPGVFVAVFVVIALALVAVWWLARRRLPPADYALAFSADAHQPAFSGEQVRSAVTSEASRIVDAALVEKVVLISLVSLCFGQVLPGVQASDLQLAIGAALVVIVNTALSHWLARRGFGWAFSLWQFIVLTVVNLVLLLVYAFLRTRFDDPVSTANVLFFVLLLTLLVTLFDRYRQVYLIRFSQSS